MAPVHRGVDNRGGLGTDLGVVASVLIKPQSPDCGQGVVRAPAGRLAEEVYTEVGIPFLLCLRDEVLGGFFGLLRVGPEALPNVVKLVRTSSAIGTPKTRLLSGERDEKSL
jgi:hypothetical protein